MDYSSVLYVLIGGAVGAFVQFLLNRKEERYLSLKKISEERYRSTLIFMKCSFDLSKKKYFSDPNPMTTEKEYLEKVIEFYYHGLLYLPDEVLIKMKVFIKDPNQVNFIGVAQSMRKDLYGMHTRLNEDEILI